MSISNRSVNLRASTQELEELYADYERQYDALVDLPEDEVDGSYLEWLESGMEIIDAELANRTEEGDHHYDSPSLEDSGLTLGSYAS